MADYSGYQPKRRQAGSPNTTAARAARNARLSEEDSRRLAIIVVLALWGLVWFIFLRSGCLDSPGKPAQTPPTLPHIEEFYSASIPDLPPLPEVSSSEAIEEYLEQLQEYWNNRDNDGQ